MMNKGQNALEFLVIVFILILFFVSLLFFLSQRMGFFEMSQNERKMNLILDVVEKEIMMASKVSGNYDRVFSLPEDLFVDNYELSLNRGRELVLSDNQGSVIRFLPIYIYGEIQIGDNKIIKRGRSIGICWNNCSEEYLFHSTGSLSCETSPNFFKDCSEVEFSNYIYSIKADCGLDITSASLNITNLNRRENYYDSSSSSSVNGVFEFSDIFYEILRSGTLRFEVTCGDIPTNYIDVFIPYGHYVFEGLKVGNSCVYKPIEALYECSADEFLDIISTVKCVGGECGRTLLWVDP